MIRVALRGLAGRKLRALLTAFAVILGVAMVSGTFVLTDTISKAFNDIFNSSYGNASAVVSGRQVIDGSTSGTPTVPASLVQRVRALPGVAGAAGAVYDLKSTSDDAKLIDASGHAIGAGGGSPTFGFGIDPSQPRLNPFSLVQGSWATGPGQVVVDRGTATSHHIAIGQRVRVATRTGIHSFTVTGTARFGTVDSLGGATISIFDVPTAQAILGKQGQLDSISVSAKQGVSSSTLVSQIQRVLPPSAVVRTGQAQATSSGSETRTFMRFIRGLLLAFGGIALFVGAFVIFNTLAITVAQRTRELATLRTLGASRTQVRRSVLAEGLVIGLFASIAGMALGVGLAKGLSWLLAALDLDLPKAGTVLEPRTAIVSLVVGVSVTMLASVIPAIRATRVPAVAALREGAVLPKSRGRLGKVAAVGLTLFGAAALAQATLGGGSAGSVLMLLGVGVIALFIGIALVSPRLVRPLARIVGAPSRALGGTPGRLASENSVRNPGRTAATAAALMIGLALVTVVATVGNGLRNSDKAAIAGTIHSDRVVTAKNGFDPIPTNAGRALASVPGVAAVSAVRTDKARAAGATVDVNGVDPATITSLAHQRWSAGSDATLRGLGDDGVVVKRRFAKDHHLTVGSRVTVVSPTGIRRAYTVRGIVDPPAFDQVDAVFGELMITQRAFDQAFPRPKDAFTLVDLAPRAGASTERAMRTALAPYPDTKVSTKDAYVQDRANGVNKLLNLLYVLLALSVLVSLFGMINTLVLSTFERTRELGMLRAIGMTRRQVRRMVRHESIVTALIGAALGIGVGLGLSALVTRALAGQGLVFQVPTGSLVAFVVVAIGAGVLAAVLPARRAGRLDVLAALKYE